MFQKTKHRSVKIVTVVMLTFSAFIARNSQAESGRSRFFLGAGVLLQDVGTLSNSTNADPSYFSAVYYQVALTGMFNIGQNWGLSPVINYTPSGISSPEQGEKFTILTSAVRLYRRLGPLDLKLGPGAMFFMVRGLGGTVDLNNGNGTTTFGIPSGSSTARMFYLTGGLGFEISRIRLDFDCIVTDPLSNRLAVNLLSTLSFGLF